MFIDSLNGKMANGSKARRHHLIFITTRRYACRYS